jgi:hypothetical protein
MSERFRCFTRTWWIDNPAWPDGREPGAGPRHYAGHPKNLTMAEAQAYCRGWNETHKPGHLSRKAEFEDVAARTVGRNRRTVRG